MKKNAAYSLLSRLLVLSGTAVLLHLPNAFAAISWSGANSGTDLNWSDAANWNGGVAPGSSDDVTFFDAGASATLGTINNTVDSLFGGTIASLQYGNTNNFHTTSIADGATLNITGTGGLVVGTPTDVGVVKNLTNAVTGLNGTLAINNNNAVISLAQGSATSLSGLRANLNMSGLGTFSANVSRIGLGSTVFPNPGNANQREAGQLILAKTNIINLGFTDTLANYQSAGKTNALEMSRNPGNNAGIMSTLLLGITNTINLDSIGAGRDKASASSAAWIGFNPAYLANSPSAYFRGVGGGNNRITWWAIGDMNSSASSSQVSVGTNDFTGGSVNALVNVLSLARDCSPSHTASATIFGVLTFNSGTIDANTVYAGNQSLGPSTSSTGLKGIINVNGSAKLVVNSSLVLGSTFTNSVAASKTSGALNINGGTVWANAISVGSYSTNNGIFMTNATLVISNSIGRPGYGLTQFAVSNSVLQLNVTGITNVIATNLVTGGTGNTISIGSAAIMASYPTQVTLVKYVGTIGGAGFNFSLAPLPPTAIGFLSNNTANSSIDLVLTTDPRPIITTQPIGNAVSPGTPVTFTVAATGAPTLGYQWRKDGTNVVDDANITGSTTSSLSFASADPTNSGNYTVVVTNAYSTATSSIAILYVSSSDVAPFVSQDPQSQTVLLGQSATFTVSGAAKPLPTYQWLKNGNAISAATNSSYSVLNAQLTDEAGYSVILSNSVGSITSAVATLTVNIAPVITNQPISTAALNGSSASFTVVAGGKPAPTYQWYKNGNAITDATNATLSFGSVAPADAATYYVSVINSASTVASSNVTLIVNSAMAAVNLSPTNASTGICPDTVIRITFNTAPVIGSAGRIRIYNATNATTPVDTIDLGLSTGIGTQGRTIGGSSYNTYPVIISGNTANIYPHSGVLTTNQTYYVTIENVINGTFKDSAGATFVGISATNAWRFSTKTTTPANGNNIVVAADGSGDFCTVQGAVDFVPNGNTTPRTINIRNGLYTEIVFINGKNNLSFVGQDRDQTLITYANNDNLNGGTSLRPSFRAAANDLSFFNLTLTNSTPKGGSQAEALRTDGKRILLLNVKLASYQDTMLNNNNGDLVYIQDSIIQGDTDFIWGGGTTFITNSEIKTLSSGTQITQARTTAGTNGFSFVGCSLTRAAGVTNCGLGRDLSFVDNNVAFVLCRIDDHITGWQNADPRDWEYGNSNLAATAAVVYNGTQLSSTDPNLTNAMTANLWLYGWSPAYAPLITGQPVAQTVNAGSAALFSVSAYAVPNPSYQWLQNGTNSPYSANSPTLTIPSAQSADAGNYSVIVSNSAGSVTSSVVALTVNLPTPPNISSAPQLQNDGNIQFSFSGSQSFGYRVWATTNIALTPVTNNWTLVSSGTFGASPVTFTDLNATNYPQRFYIISSP